jgi:hypothetical protein
MDELETDYPLIPILEIEDEARKIAVRWVEDYQQMSVVDLHNKHKLASDIMNYARRYSKKLNISSVVRGLQSDCCGAKVETTEIHICQECSCSCSPTVADSAAGKTVSGDNLLGLGYSDEQREKMK